MNCVVCKLRGRYTGLIRRGRFNFQAEHTCPNGHVWWRIGRGTAGR